MRRRTAPRGTNRRLAGVIVFALLSAAWVAHAPKPARAGLTCDPGMGCAELRLLTPGLGAGKITGHGISCSVDNNVKTGDCAQVFNFPGETLVVELTMTAAPGSVYLDSTGDTHGPGVPVVEHAFLYNSDDTIQYKEAIFKLGLQTITLVLAGSGSGVVHHSEVGVQCPPDCEVRYDYGVEFGMGAVADPGSYFNSWSGPCAGKGSTCVIDMPRSTTITVTFELTPKATATPKPATPRPTVARTAPPTAKPSPSAELPSSAPTEPAPATSAPATTAPATTAAATTAPSVPTTTTTPVETPAASAGPIAPTSADPGFGSGLLIGLLVAGIVALVGGFLFWKRRAPTPT